jgi:adenylyltransferase/sulfurtransferase
MHLEITPQEVIKKIDRKDSFTLIDVRTEREHRFCHIEGSTHMPLDKLEGLYLQLEKDAEIITYCHHGMRSLKAVEFLISRGFTNVKSMSGGIHLWSEEIDASIPQY